ncbi:hypothetical protein B0H34DRAFT_535666 [Crassisporium funariophilum]|nr:hypothetical protein B0H34DRAFT_535666 [Crassisporium funariophilum]
MLAMDLLPSSLPPRVLLTSFLLFSHLPISGRARSISQPIADVNLRHRCAFELGGYAYDLCPLISTVDASTSIANDRGEGSSSGRRFYEVAFGGLSISKEALNPSTATCNEDTRICMTNSAEPTSEERNSQSKDEGAGRIPNARKGKEPQRPRKITAFLALHKTKEDGGALPSLRLFLDGKELEGVPQSAIIDIECSSDFGTLNFLEERHGKHSFSWATPHGCPIKLLKTKPLRIMEGESNEDSEKEKGDDDLLPNDRMSTTRRWMAIIFTIFFTCTICGTVLVTSPRARHFTVEHLKTFSYALVPIMSRAALKLRPIGKALAPTSVVRFGARFRQGDSQLVRWAQEDMSLLEAEDMMVNGGGAQDVDGWNADELDEYIPLTLSPKYGKGRRVRSYGTTPDVETFEERGLVGGIGKFFRHK